MTDQAVIWLPWPPSVWKLYGKRKDGRKYRTKAYDSWRHEAGWMTKFQQVRPVPGVVNIRMELSAPDGRTRDADNYEKAILDLLVSLGKIDGDGSRIVRRCDTEWIEDETPGARVIITSVSRKIESKGEAA